MSLVIIPITAGIAIAGTAFTLTRYRNGVLVFGDEDPADLDGARVQN